MTVRRRRQSGVRPVRVRRAPAERLRAYTRDFPFSDEGHDYVIKSIPPALWSAVSERAVVEQRSMRWILLTLLERYEKGGITL